MHGLKILKMVCGFPIPFAVIFLKRFTMPLCIIFIEPQLIVNLFMDIISKGFWKPQTKFGVLLFMHA